uniref:C2H2-type domain-containing protein n=1 Tax=Periophthalmus magnuspinnatus TaxID=409849 RepID=A0A3B4ACP6_9GOBI
MEIEEQTEPLDLSMPKKRERRYGRLLEDWGESSLIMEVDEYEGEGDRDIVEDDSDLEVFCTSNLQLSSSLFDPSIDCNAEDVLLIDDQGIPYTLNPLSPDWTPDGQGARRVLYCQLCPRVFFYMSDLERHAITHSQKKPHVCPQCGKAFKRSSHLQRHKHIHTGQRNYVCPICAKRFREAGELQRHQRVHTGEKPYQCQLCHTRFAERNTLRRHTKRKHPYHQVAMEMLSDKKNGGGKGASAVQEEESAECGKQLQHG